VFSTWAIFGLKKTSCFSLVSGLNVRCQVLSKKNSELNKSNGDGVYLVRLAAFTTSQGTCRQLWFFLFCNVSGCKNSAEETETPSNMARFYRIEEENPKVCKLHRKTWFDFLRKVFFENYFSELISVTFVVYV
jgi:hypothetical protein